MPKKEDSYTISDLGNWNVAKEYSHFKIMKYLYLADEYVMIAIFGSASLLEELENEHPVDNLKIHGLTRLINTLILLIDNSLFACKVSGTKKDMESYREDLKKILNIVPVLYETKSLKNKQYIEIIPEKFGKVLEMVLELKASINEPLNKNHLIFVDKEEFDPKEFKKQVFENAISRG